MFHLILIHLYGKVWIAEPNDFILWAEIVFTVGIIGLGIERLVSVMRR